MRTTFYKLIGTRGRIEIPIIQRDYAQGREDQDVVIVRDDFLNALHGALCLPEGNLGLPLDLDFVYGSIVNGSFQPLDGQQRLTTLFLLHWYLAWADGCSEDFRRHLIAGSGRSRFGYEVRPSSREFINALANYEPDIAAADCPNLVKMITDQPWYFRSWQFDPTIRSALSVLDRMHAVFRQTPGLYTRLTNDSTPPVTFQLLDLEQFDLSDDLYIKMNARGKQLTPFETFKARFEQHLKSNEFAEFRPAVCSDTPIYEFFAQQIDTRWSDFFWPFRDKKTVTFDDAVMNLLRAVIMVTRAPNTAATSNDLVDLRNFFRTNSYAWFHASSWLDQEMILALITLLHRWSSGPDASFQSYLPDTRYIDETALFEDIITQPTGLTFEQLVQLAGYVQYLVHAHGEVNQTAFNDWMRVVFNLATNTDYNRTEDLRRSFAGLRDLASQMDDVTRYLAGPEGDVRGFFRYQVAEERIKAHLLGFGGEWPERIDRAEQHRYFKGQIGFLLRFCGVNLDDPDEVIVRLDAEAASALGARFERYFACAAQMFDDIEDNRYGAGQLWGRALLAVGDYLLRVGQNKSLLTPALNIVWSWKRLLRNAAEGFREGQVLKDLWDRLGPPASFETDLVNIIESEPNIDPWRRAIIATPAIYNYGQYKMLRFSYEGGIYLLRKSQMNGRHAELFTYCAYEDLKAEEESLSLMVTYRETISTYDEPVLSLCRRIGQYDVTFYLGRAEHDADGYELYLAEPNDPNDLEGNLRTVLEDNGFEEQDGWLTRSVERVEIKAAVRSLASTLAQSVTDAA